MIPPVPCLAPLACGSFAEHPVPWGRVHVGALSELRQQLHPQAAADQEVFWGRGHPYSQHSGWWVREQPSVLQEPGESMEKGGTRGGCGAAPHGPAGTRQAVRKALLPAVLLDLGAALLSLGAELEQSFAAVWLQSRCAVLGLGWRGSPPGPACSALATPVPFPGRGQAGSCPGSAAQRLGCMRGSREGDWCFHWCSAVPT